MISNYPRSRPVTLDLPACARVSAGRVWLTALLAAGLAVFTAAPPAPALAAPQEEDEDTDDTEGEEDEDMEMEPDRVRRPSGEVPSGASETPGAPEGAVGMEVKVEEPLVKEPVRPPGYPVELALRPITLEAGMVELSANAPLYASPAAVTAALRARYGVTERVEVGLRYAALGADEGGAATGKGLALDVVVGITDWVAAQLSVPVLFDPFAMGVTLGVPLKFRFGQRFALFFGSDLLSFRVKEFVPTYVDPRVDEARAAVIETGTLVSRGNYRLVGGAIYQLEPHMAIAADFGVASEDFGEENTAVPLGGTFTYSAAPYLDFSARIGFDDIGQGRTFSLAGGLAVRL
jgi:hypothetical protein